MRKFSPIFAAAIAATVLCSGVFAESAFVYEDDSLKLSPYTGLTYSVEKEEITEEDIEERIQSDLEDYSENLEVFEGEAKYGDTVNIDYEGTIDGEPFEGGSDMETELTIGEGWFLEDFENGIVGMKVGETKDVTFTFPEDYDEAVAGKEVTFAITLNSLLVPQESELNDEWVKKNMEMDTVEEYRESVKKALEDDKQSFFDTAVRDQLMTKIIESSEVKELPQDRMDYLFNSYMEYWQGYADMFGLEFTDFIGQFFGMDQEAFDKYLNEQLSDYLTQCIILDKVAELEGIEITDEEFDQYLVDMGATEGYESLDAFKEEMSGNDMLDSLRSEYLESRAFDWILENSTFVPAEETEEDEEAAEEVTEGAAEETTEGAAEETTEGAAEEVTEAAAEETTEAAAEETTEGAAEETTEAAVQP